MRQLLLGFASVCLVAGVMWSAPLARAASGPPLNTGSEYEELVAQPVGFGDQGSITVSNLQCNPGGVSTFDLTASGMAYGPYPGTFTETATVTIGPSGELQSFDATFTIESGATTIEGTKTLYPDDPDRYSSGSCAGTFSLDPGACDSSQSLFASTTYHATISDESGSFTDSGVATVQLDASQPNCGGESVGNFIQTFVASSTTNPLPGYLELRQSASVNDVGSSHTVTAYVATEGNTGETVAGATVYFSVTGADSATGACTTDPSGLCDFTYQGPIFPGSDQISAYVDVNGNGVQDAGEPTASVVKQWVLPASNTGQATGSGKVGALAFDFSAKSDRGVVKGTCSVILGETTVNCLDVTAYVQNGNTVTIYGHATINGTATLYKITVTDNGRPGTGRDTFRIETSSGFSGGGTLTAGNLEVT
jgi:hypothetical protein